MTNKQWYQRTFSALHASEYNLTEVKTMKHTKRIYVSRLAAACLAGAMMVGLASAAYAADLGGIQRSVQIWIDGDKTDAVLDMQGSGYTVTYQTEDGVSHQMGGGGVAIDENGNEHPLTETDVLEQLGAPQVEYRQEGSIWVCYQDREMEITDRFDEEGVCYVQLKTDGGIRYMTIKADGGYASSPHSYPSPRSFDTGEE